MENIDLEDVKKLGKKKVRENIPIVITRSHPEINVEAGKHFKADSTVLNGEYMYRFFNHKDEECFVPVEDAIKENKKDDIIIEKIVEMTLEIKRMIDELSDLKKLVDERN